MLTRIDHLASYMPPERLARAVIEVITTDAGPPSGDPSTDFDRPDWLDGEEFPFESHVVEIDGHRVHYVDEGTGPTLLFVHAGPAWSFVFRDVVEDLRHRFRCVAPDVPGTGLSTATGDYEPSIEDASRVLESLIDAVGLEAVTLVVHDVGGPVAFGVAARRPELVDRFVVVGSFGWPLSEGYPGVARFIRIATGSTFRFLNTNLNVLARLTSTTYGVGRRLSRPGRRVFRGPFRSKAARRNALAMLGSAIGSDGYLRDVDRALRTTLADRPVLLLFGEHDEGRAAGFQDEWERRFPDARSEVVADANHFPMADSPHRVAATIEEWYADSVDPTER